MKKRRHRRRSHAGFWTIVFLILVFSGYVIVHGMHNGFSTESIAPSQVQETFHPVSTITPDENAYYMAQLDQRQLQLYETLLEGAENHNNTIVLSGQEEDVLTAWMALSNDHPEIFWHMTSYRTNALKKVSSVTMDWDETMESESQQIEDIADSIIASISSDMSEYDKAMMLLKWIVDNTVPDERENIPEAEMKRMQDIRSVFLDHKSVCSGYAAAFEYLLQKAGIRCTVVIGRATSQGKTENHAWNLIQLNGNWYWSDPMWADPVVSSDHEITDHFRPGYLCLTDNELFRTHEIDVTAGMSNPLPSMNNIFTFPACTDISLNYYVLNGGEFTFYDLGTVQSLIQQRVSNGLPVEIDMQFPSYEEMNQAYQDLTMNNFANLDQAVRAVSNPYGTRSYTISYDPSLYSIAIQAS